MTKAVQNYKLYIKTIKIIPKYQNKYLKCCRIDRNACRIFHKILVPFLFSFQLIEFFFGKPEGYANNKLLVELITAKLSTSGCRIFKTVIGHKNQLIVQLNKYSFSVKNPFKIVFSQQIYKISIISLYINYFKNKKNY